MRDNPIVGCLALIGGAIVVCVVLSLGWGLVVSGGPILGGLALVAVFAAGFILGSGGR